MFAITNTHTCSAEVMLQDMGVPLPWPSLTHPTTGPSDPRFKVRHTCMHAAGYVVTHSHRPRVEFCSVGRAGPVREATHTYMNRCQIEMR